MVKSKETYSPPKKIELTPKRANLTKAVPPKMDSNTLCERPSNASRMRNNNSISFFGRERDSLTVVDDWTDSDLRRQKQASELTPREDDGPSISKTDLTNINLPTLDPMPVTMLSKKMTPSKRRTELVTT